MKITFALKLFMDPMNNLLTFLLHFVKGHASENGTERGTRQHDK